MKKFIASIPVLAALTAPFMALAQVNTTNTIQLGFIAQIILQIRNILKILIPLLVTLAILYFFWELVKYIKSDNDAAKKKEALKGIFMSLLAIFIMLAFMGLINIANNLLGGNLVGQDISGSQLPQLNF
jgi:Na+/proline symporter